jgi:hypothetical protein
VDRDFAAVKPNRQRVADLARIATPRIQPTPGRHGRCLVHRAARGASTSAHRDTIKAELAYRPGRTLTESQEEMSAQVGGGLDDETSPVAPLCSPMKDSFGLLFERARREGRVHADVSGVKVLALIGAAQGPQDRPYRFAVSGHRARWPALHRGEWPPLSLIESWGGSAVHAIWHNDTTGQRVMRSLVAYNH